MTNRRHLSWDLIEKRRERDLESFKWLPEWVIKGRDACDMCLSADWQLHVHKKGIFIQLLNWGAKNEASGALSSLTFSLNPFVLDAVLPPVARLIVFRVVHCVRQVDDEAETRQWCCDVLGGVPERAERMRRWKNVDYCSFLPLGARKTLANVLRTKRRIN